MNYEMRSKIDYKALIIFIIYMAAVYLTLPFAPELFEILARKVGPNLGKALNALIAGLAAEAAFLSFPKIRNKGLSGISLFFLAALTYIILLFFYTPFPSEKIHLPEYAVAGWLAFRIFGRRDQDMNYIYAAAVVFVAGYVDELIQLILPNRVFEAKDVCINVLSGLAALLIIKVANGTRLDNLEE